MSPDDRRDEGAERPNAPAAGLWTVGAQGRVCFLSSRSVSTANSIADILFHVRFSVFDFSTENVLKLNVKKCG